MGEAAEQLAKEIAKLPATLFSPAKMVYIAYVILLWRSSTAQNWRFPLSQFLWVSLAFLVVEIIHNDFCRIRLNHWGEKYKQEWDKPEWFVKREKK